MYPQRSTVNFKDMGDSLLKQDTIPNITNYNQPTLSVRDTYGKIPQSESNGKALGQFPMVQLLTNYAVQQTIPPEFGPLPTELVLQIWEDRRLP